MILKSIYLDTGDYLIHSMDAEQLKKFDEVAADIFEILSDNYTLKYVPGKRLNSIAEAEVFLKTMLINIHTGRSFQHFITDKNKKKIVGLIDLISPMVAREHYQIDHYPFFIEFYLSSFASGCYLMTNILPLIIDQIKLQGIQHIGAVVNRKNTAARKVLRNASFTYKKDFDEVQDLYEISQ